MPMLILGDIMFFTEIQKYALKFNKKKYLKLMCVPLVYIIVLAIYCVTPFLLSSLSDLILAQISDKYSIVCSILKCLFILISGFSACIFYSTVSIGEEAGYSGRLSGKKNRFKRFIYWFRFKNAFKAFRLKAAVFFLKLFWTLVFMLPCILTFSVVLVTAFSGGIEAYLFSALMGGTVVLFTVGLIFRFIAIQRYFLAQFILAENPNDTVLQVIRKSKNLIDGQIFTVVKFKLAFLPFILPCLLFIPLFFIYPHYKQSRSILAKELTV